MDYDIESERKLLASLLQWYDRHDEDLTGNVLALGVTSECFFSQEHRIVFDAVGALHEAGERIDEMSVAERIREDGNDGEFTDPLHVELNRISESTTTVSIWESWAKAIIQARESRDMTIAAAKIRETVESGDLEAARALMAAFSEGVESPGGDVFADVGAVMDAGIVRPVPDLAPMDGGSGFLLYSARVNEIHGEPSVGKTNISLAMCLAVMREGGHVIYLDPEDCVEGILSRLLSFGADPDMLREFFHYAEYNPADWPKYYAAANKLGAKLVVLDGLAEAVAADGLNEKEEADILGFFRKLRPFRKCGAAILISDHVTKDSDSRGRWSRGSGAKMGRYDGVSYSVTLGKPYTPTKAGYALLKVAKDRNGGVGAFGVSVATIHFQPDDFIAERTLVSIQKCEEPEGQGEGNDWKPTALMAKIVEYLRVNPDANKRELRSLGKGTYIDKAIRELESEGKIKASKHGIRGAMRYELTPESAEKDDNYEQKENGNE